MGAACSSSDKIIKTAEVPVAAPLPSAAVPQAAAPPPSQRSSGSSRLSASGGGRPPSARPLSPLLYSSTPLLQPSKSPAVELHPALVPTPAEEAPRAPQSQAHTYAVDVSGKDLSACIMGPAVSKPLAMRVRPAVERRSLGPSPGGGVSGAKPRAPGPGDDTLGVWLGGLRSSGPSPAEKRRAEGSGRPKVAYGKGARTASHSGYISGAASVAASSASRGTRQQGLSVLSGASTTVSPPVVKRRFNLHLGAEPKLLNSRGPDTLSGPSLTSVPQWFSSLRSAAAPPSPPEQGKRLAASVASTFLLSQALAGQRPVEGAMGSTTLLSSPVSLPQQAFYPTTTTSSGSDSSPLSEASLPSSRAAQINTSPIHLKISPGGSAGRADAPGESHQPFSHPLSLSQRPYALALQELGKIPRPAEEQQQRQEGVEEQEEEKEEEENQTSSAYHSLPSPSTAATVLADSPSASAQASVSPPQGSAAPAEAPPPPVAAAFRAFQSAALDPKLTEAFHSFAAQQQEPRNGAASSTGQ
jgi:hypothetical protein